MIHVGFDITEGLKAGDEIVTGSYQVIRSLKNAGDVKVDNKPPSTAAKT